MKNINVLTALLLISFYSCKVQKVIQDKLDNNHKKDSIAFKLCELYGSDQISRKKNFFYDKLDSLNFNLLNEFIKKNGFPTKKNVGKKNMKFECVNSVAFSILLHSPHRLINEKKTLNIYLNEVKKGNLKMKSLLTVLDKYYWVRKDKEGKSMLVYGSQFGTPCLKYRKKSDSLRAELGLKPLKISQFKICK